MPADVTEADLLAAFADYCPIAGKVAQRDEQGQRGYGFVRFQTAEDQARAVRDKRDGGIQLGGQRSAVKSARSSPFDGQREQPAPRTVVVSGMAAGTSLATLAAAFGQFGKVLEARWPGRADRFGYRRTVGRATITFEAPEAVRKAIEGSVRVEEKSLVVREAQKRGQTDAAVWVGELPDDATAESVEGLFAPAKPVAVMLTEMNGQRGAIVQFENREARDRAWQARRVVRVGSRDVRVLLARKTTQKWPQRCPPPPEGPPE
jgi:RNA recognition motif-containing protein